MINAVLTEYLLKPEAGYIKKYGHSEPEAKQKHGDVFPHIDYFITFIILLALIFISYCYNLTYYFFLEFFILYKNNC